MDDNALSRKVLAQYLAAWGFQCKQAIGAGEALAMLRKAAKSQKPFSIAMLDMQLSKMDGEILGRKIKADPALKETHLVMLTSMGMRGDSARLQKQGFRAFLLKPVKQSMLFDCIVELLMKDGDFINPVQAAPSEQSSLITRHSVQETRKKRITVLVVEDNHINQKLACHLVNKFGYLTDTADNGQEAVEALSRKDYSLVLMDLQMPVMGGLEAARIIRKGSSGVRQPDIPIIALTADVLKGADERCRKAGMNDFLAKPINPEALLEAVKRWALEKPGAAKMPTIDGEPLNPGPTA